MVFRDIDKKALIDNAATVSSKITIVGTDITFTEDDFISEWDYEDYRYVPENGFIGQFVERIFDGKLKDLPNDINIENKEINLQIGINNGITGETTYYDYGNFIVTKIGEQDTTGISTFESADYTKKFNAEYVDSLTYPCLALELANSACEQAGVELATKGYAYCYAVPKEGLVAGTYRFLIDNTSYEFVISENLNFYDSIMYIVDEKRMVLKRVNEDFSITRTDLDYKVTTSSTSTELKVRKTGYYDFINNDFVIENNQFESTDTLREVIKSVAKLAYTWVRVGTDNKVYLDFKKKTSSSYGLTINGKSIQDGKPTPTAPIEIKNVEGVTNLFDKDNTSSAIAGTSGYVASNYIPVKNGDILYKTSSVMWFFYDSTKLGIGNASGSTSIEVNLENVAYVRCNVLETDIDTFMITKNQPIPNSYVPYGRWLEVKSIGKNMLDLSSFKETTANGVTLIPKGNNTFTLKGTSTGHSNHAIDYKIPQEWLGKTLTLSVNENFKGNVGFKGKNTSGDIFVVDTEKSKSKSLTITQEIIDKIYVFDIYANLSFTEEVTFTIQLEEDTATSHEPYKEHTALIDLNKKNLFDKDNYNLLNAYIDSSNLKITSGASSSTFYVECKPNTNYTISKEISTIFCVGHISTIPQIGSVLDGIVRNDTASSITLKTGASAKYLVIWARNGDMSGEITEEEVINSLKIYEGIGTEDYYELCKIGDTKDTFKDGVLTQRIGKVVLDGTQTISLDGTGVDDNETVKIAFYNLFSEVNKGLADDIKLFCTHLKGKQIWYADEEGLYINGKSLVMRMNKSIVGTTYSQINAWLSENNVTVYYELATPIEHTLDYETLELFDDVNNISFNDDLITEDDYLFVEDKITIDDYYETEKQPELYGPVNKVLLGMSTVDGENAYNAKLVDEIESLTIEGKSYQDGKPTPTAPIEIKNVEGVTNLFDYISKLKSESYGLTSVINKDGSITTIGVPTTNYVTISGYVDITDALEDGETYIAFQNANNYIWLEIEAVDLSTSTTKVWYGAKTGEKTFVVDKSTYTYKARIVSSTTSVWGTEPKTITNFYAIIKGDVKKRFAPYGRWLEVKSVGKNLFNKDSVVQGYLNSNGSINTSATSDKTSDFIEVQPNTNYIRTTTNGNIYLDENYQFISYSWSYKLTTPENCKYVRISVLTDKVDDEQLEIGETHTPYEPYKETTALVDMNKKNWFEYAVPTSYTNGLTFIKNNNSSFVASGTITSTWANLSANGCLPTPLKAGTYTISHTNLIHNISVIFTFEDGTESGRYSLKGKNFVVATFEKVVTRARVFVESLTSGNAYTIEDDIKIFEGIEVEHNDYYSIKEDDTFKDGKYIQKRAKVVLNGSADEILNGIEEYISGSTSTKGVFSFMISNEVKLMTHFKNANLTECANKTAFDNLEDGEFNTRTDTIDRVYFRISSITSVADLRTWLSENPVTIEYELATPIEHNLNYEILELHEGYNSVSTNDELEPNMIITISDIDNNVTTYSGDTIIANLSDNEETSLQIWDNPLTYTEDLRKIALNGSESLFGVRYTPMTTQTVGHPWLEASDYVKLTNLSNQTLYTYPLDRKLSYKGYIKSDISSKAPTLTEQKYEFNGDTDTRLKKTQISVDKANQRITAVASDISDTNEKVSQLTITTGEIKTEVSQKATKTELSNTKTELNNNINTAVDNIEVGGRNLFVKKNLVTYNVDSWVWNDYTLSCTCSKGSAGPRFSSSLFTVGEIYTLSFKFKKTGGTLVDIGGHRAGFTQQAFYVDGEKVSTNYAVGYSLDDNTDTHTISVTLKYHGTDGTDNNLYIQVNRQNSNTPANFDIWDIKLEKGNKPTDWTPAPEDVDNNIDTAKTDAINSANASTDNKLKNYSTTTQMNSAITQKADSILSTVSTTYTTKTESTNNINAAKQAAIDSANASTDGKLKNYSTTTQMNSAIDQKADSITSTVSATYITKANSAEDIKKAVEGIDIGSDNLVKGTREFIADSSRVNGFSIASTAIVEDDTTEQGFKVASISQTGLTSTNIQSIYSSMIDINLVKNKDIVISFDCKVDDMTVWDEQKPFIYEYYDASGTRIAYRDIFLTDANLTPNTLESGVWTRLEYKRNVGSTNVTFVSGKTLNDVATIGVRFTLFRNGSIHFRKLKVELGNKSSGWSPSIYDPDTEVEVLKQKVTTLEQTSNGFSITISELNEFKGSTDSKLEGINQDIQDVNTELGKKQSAEDVSKAMETRLEEGVSKVIPKRGYSFTQEGLVISEDGNEMSTVIDEDGMTINRSGNEVLVADHDGVVAYNLHANTYLLVGTNSRFENYTNDNGEARTGCFWIG